MQTETEQPQETTEPTENQEQTQEQPPPERAQEPAEAKAEGEGEEKDADAGEEKDADAKPEEKHRRAGGWQRKIERLERERAMLLDQLAAQRGGQPPQGQAPAKEKTPEEQAAEYIDNLVAQRLAQAEAQRRQQEMVTQFQQRTQEVRAKYSDFDEVVESASDVPVPPAVQQALLTRKAGPEIMYTLAKNPAELARIAALPPFDAAIEVGRLEASLASSTAAPVKPRSATRPPAPPTNVGGGTSSTRSLEDLPLAEYKRRMRSGGR